MKDEISMDEFNSSEEYYSDEFSDEYTYSGEEEWDEDPIDEEEEEDDGEGEYIDDETIDEEQTDYDVALQSDFEENEHDTLQEQLESKDITQSVTISAPTTLNNDTEITENISIANPSSTINNVIKIETKYLSFSYEALQISEPQNATLTIANSSETKKEESTTTAKIEEPTETEVLTSVTLKLPAKETVTIDPLEAASVKAPTEPMKDEIEPISIDQNVVEQPTTSKSNVIEPSTSKSNAIEPSTSKIQKNVQLEKETVKKVSTEKLKGATSKIPKPKDTIKMQPKKIPLRSKSFAGNMAPIGISTVKSLQQRFMDNNKPKPVTLKKNMPMVERKKSITDAMTKFTQPSNNDNPGPSTSSSIFRSHSRIPKKKYHETCFSDDNYDSTSTEEELEPLEIRQRKQSMPVFRSYVSVQENEPVDPEELARKFVAEELTTNLAEAQLAATLVNMKFQQEAALWAAKEASDLDQAIALFILVGKLFILTLYQQIKQE